MAPFINEPVNLYIGLWSIGLSAHTPQSLLPPLLTKAAQLMRQSPEQPNINFFVSSKIAARRIPIKLFYKLQAFIYADSNSSKT
jgi:hypothetical protein